MIATSLIFLVFILLFVLLPGVALLRASRFSHDSDYFTTLALVLALGIMTTTLYTILVRVFHLPWASLWFIPVLSIAVLFKFRNSNVTLHTSSLTLRHYTFVGVIILFCSLLQSLTLFSGGRKMPDGIVIPALHDTMWNIALLEELSDTFPPTHPGMAGVPLKNNHFFYPLFLSAIRQLFSLDIYTLYYRLAPLFVAVTFGLSIYAVSTIFFTSAVFRSLTVFLGYFAGSISYILPLFMGRSFNWQGNTFLSDQPFDQLTNPYTVLGFVFILTAGFLLSQTFKNNKNLYPGLFLSALVLGGAYGFKSFAGILGAAGFLVFLLIISVRRKKRLAAILGGLFFLIFFIPTFFLISDPKKTSLNWAPGWLLSQMMTATDKLNISSYAQLESFYTASASSKGLFKIRSQAFLIYILGNLGVRIFGLVYYLMLGWSFIPSRKMKELPLVHAYILPIVGLGLGIPLLFNLKGSPYNIIQFTPYALLLLVFPTVLMVSVLFRKIKNRHHPFIAVSMILAFVLMAIPVNLRNTLEKLSKSYDALSYSELEAVAYLRRSADRNAVVLVDYRSFVHQPMYIPALAKRRLYLADEGFALQTLQDPSERKRQIAEIFTDQNSETLHTIGVAYIYAHRQVLTETFLKYLSRDYAKVFENSSGAIFKKI